MSTKVKERLKKMAIEMSHEERLELDKTLDEIYMRMGGIIVNEERGCDRMIESISDIYLRGIISMIKKKKKKKVLVEAEA